MNPPFVDTLLGEVGTAKVLVEGVYPGYKRRLDWSAERKQMEGLGEQINLQALSMIPVRPESSGASGSTESEMIAKGHYKTNTVSFEWLRIVEHHSSGRPTDSRSSPFVVVVVVVDTAWPQMLVGAISVVVVGRGEVLRDVG